MTPQEIEHKYRNRMSLSPAERAEIERLHAEMVARANSEWGGTPPTAIDPVESAAVELPEDPEIRRANSGLYANLPPVDAEPPEPQQPEAPTAADREAAIANRTRDILRMTRPLVYQGAAVSPEAARAQAEAEYDNPRDPNSSETWNPQVRSAVRSQLDAEAAKRDADMRASMGGGEPRFSARDFRQQREEAEAAKAADAQRKWDEWTTGGSLERMEQYAPQEYNQRWEAAAESRRKENLREYLNRYDFEVDPETGLSKGELYRRAQNQEDKEMLRRTDPQANRALVRQLEQMGIDAARFGDWRSPGFEREAALDAKNRAMASGNLGGRYGAVQRRAQLRQSPAEYLGRQDITDAQRRTLAFLMSGGKGATANDVAALNAKMLFEGINQGVNLQRAMRIGDMDIKDRALAMEMDQRRLTAAQQQADEFYQRRRNWGGALDAEAYDDLIAMLSGMGLSDTQAQGLARRYKRSGGRADRTAPPAS